MTDQYRVIANDSRKVKAAIGGSTFRIQRFAEWEGDIGGFATDDELEAVVGDEPYVFGTRLVSGHRVSQAMSRGRTMRSVIAR